MTSNSVYLPNPSPGWALIAQSGVLVDCQVNQPLSTLLTEDFGLSPAQMAKIEALVLDGSPVDDLSATMAYDQSRLALAAGLPGIAGLAIKKDSPVKALRNSITYSGRDQNLSPTKGRIRLALYSLVLNALAPFFLARGVWVTATQLRRYGSFYPQDVLEFQGRQTVVSQFLANIPLDSTETFFLKAALST
ncbi:MAG: hypothetical protein LBI10_09605 [Deltaproteobacteria bacterium]|nr:hypothetical protein [Deltaproteobacteria bacterium]